MKYEIVVESGRGERRLTVDVDVARQASCSTRTAGLSIALAMAAGRLADEGIDHWALVSAEQVA